MIGGTAEDDGSATGEPIVKTVWEVSAAIVAGPPL
jgi:hypothetical protein